MKIKLIRFYIPRPVPGGSNPIFRPFSDDVATGSLHWEGADFNGRTRLTKEEIQRMFKDVCDWLKLDWLGLMFHHELGELRILGSPRDQDKALERLDIIMEPEDKDPVHTETLSILADMIGPVLLELGYQNRIGENSIRNAVQWTRKK